MAPGEQEEDDTRSYEHRRSAQDGVRHVLGDPVGAHSRFFLSALVQAVVSKPEMSRLLPDDSPNTLSIATALGAASSSCSYAAVALARSIFRKGANFTVATVFELASTNLVVEL